MATIWLALGVVHPKSKGAVGAHHPGGKLPKLGVKPFLFPPQLVSGEFLSVPIGEENASKPRHSPDLRARGCIAGHASYCPCSVSPGEGRGQGRRQLVSSCLLAPGQRCTPKLAAMALNVSQSPVAWQSSPAPHSSELTMPRVAGNPHVPFSPHPACGILPAGVGYQSKGSQ